MDGITRATDEHKVAFDLLTENPVYKPFRYPWAYEAWLTQQRVHCLSQSLPRCQRRARAKTRRCPPHPLARQRRALVAGHGS